MTTWDARLARVEARQDALEKTMVDFADQRADGMGSLMNELGSLRTEIRAVGSARALARASIHDVDETPTGQYLARHTPGDHDPMAALSVWKARPAIVAGFVGSLVSLAIAFGAPISKGETGAIIAAVTMGLAVLASMRNRRTTKALVRDGERRGARMGPQQR